MPGSLPLVRQGGERAKTAISSPAAAAVGAQQGGEDADGRRLADTAVYPVPSDQWKPVSVPGSVRLEVAQDREHAPVVVGV